MHSCELYISIERCSFQGNFIKTTVHLKASVFLSLKAW